jgi:hypothetical protein
MTAEDEARRRAEAMYPRRGMRLHADPVPATSRRGRRVHAPVVWVVLVGGGGFVERGIELGRGPTTGAAWEAAVPELRSRMAARLAAITAEWESLDGEHARILAAMEQA